MVSIPHNRCKHSTKNLSLAAALAIHGFSGLVGNAAGWQPIDANLRSRHCGSQRLRDVGGHGDA
jgi:hypothetical protein